MIEAIDFSNRIKLKEMTLRPIHLKDVNDIFELRSNPIVNELITRKSPKSISETIHFINLINENASKKETIFWGIELLSTQQIIGTICYHNFSSDFKYAEIGYELHPKFHRKGLMSIALNSVLLFGFTKMKLDVIEAFTHKNNKASISLLQKHQFVFQENRRDKVIKNNRIFQLKI